MIVSPLVSTRTPLSGLGLTDVALTGGCWGVLQGLNASAMIDHAESWMERLGWIANFDKAASGAVHDRQGREFSDSEVYKLMEAMSWEVVRAPNPGLEARLERLTSRVAAAQSADGYISTKFGHDGLPPRYSDLQWGHELYCMGHLIQAAVARARTAGMDDLLVEVGIRAADHICETFSDQGNRGICGHPEVETALVELFRVTGNRAYLDQARRFIRRRGYGVLGDSEMGPAYWQDDGPIAEATVLRGHAVRAMYLMAGAVDVAVEDGDADLLDALRRQMSAGLARRTYLTGGMGSRHTGEAFGQDWELPPDRAYCETCAGIGAVMACQRLLLATGESRWADMAERILYNVVAASPGSDGRSFFYANPLQQRVPGEAGYPDSVSRRAGTSVRASWFEVSCCPTNLTRFIASLGSYVVTRDHAGIQIHQYAPMSVVTEIGAGDVELEVATTYPETGQIRVRIVSCPDEEWTLSLRVPSWSAESWVSCESAVERAEPGYVRLTRVFSPGDVVELNLDVTPRWTRPDPRIDAVRGQAAVEKGPLVMTMESLDLDGLDLEDIAVDTSQPPEVRDGRVWVSAFRRRFSDVSWPYASCFPFEEEDCQISLVEYRNWGRRGPTAMRVWAPVA